MPDGPDTPESPPIPQAQLTVPGAPPIGGSIFGQQTSYSGYRSAQLRGSATKLMQLGTLGDRLVLECRNLDSVFVDVEGWTINAAYPSSTMQHMVSEDGTKFDKLTGTTDVTAEGKSAAIPVTGHAFYALQVTTPAGAAYQAKVTIQGKANT